VCMHACMRMYAKDHTGMCAIFHLAHSYLIGTRVLASICVCVCVCLRVHCVRVCVCAFTLNARFEFNLDKYQCNAQI